MSVLMLIDDTWATVGSANLHRFSMFGNSEMNVASYSPGNVRSFRVALFAEHLAQDTSSLDDVAALCQFKQIARANRERFLKGSHDWQGLAFSLNVLSYGREVQVSV